MDKEYSITIEGKSYKVKSREWYARTYLKGSASSELSNVGKLCNYILGNYPKIPKFDNPNYPLSYFAKGIEAFDAETRETLNKIPINLIDFLTKIAPSENMQNISKDSELGKTFMLDQVATSKEPPQRDETLDLFNLLDCLLLKTNFKISKSTKDPDQLRILNNAFYRILGELKDQSIYTPLSSMPRLVITKSKKPEIEIYLREQKTEIQKELNVTDKEFNSLATFSWTWVWFSFAKLTSPEITKRYHTLVVTGLTNTLESLLFALKETTTETYKLRAKEDKLALFIELKSLLEMLRDGTDIAGFTKVLLEAQKDITPAEAEIRINREVTNIELALKNDIIKTKKAPRKVILC